MHGTSRLELSAKMFGACVGIAYWRSGIVEWKLRRERSWGRYSVCPKPPHLDRFLSVDLILMLLLYLNCRAPRKLGTQCCDVGCAMM